MMRTEVRAAVVVVVFNRVHVLCTCAHEIVISTVGGWKHRELLYHVAINTNTCIGTVDCTTL